MDFDLSSYFFDQVEEPPKNEKIISELNPDHHIESFHANQAPTDLTDYSRTEPKPPIIDPCPSIKDGIENIPVAVGSIGKPKKRIVKAPQSKKKKKKRTNCIKNLVKNYLPITCNVFTHKLVERKDPGLCRIVRDWIAKISQQTGISEKDLERQLFDYVEEFLYGKKDEKSRASSLNTRQYKIRSKRNIEERFHTNESDSEEIKLIKTLLREIVRDFFHSESFRSWVANEYKAKHEENREFFLNKVNVENIIQVYQEPSKRRRFA